MKVTPVAFFGRPALLYALLLVAAVGLAAPASAHKDHDKARQAVAATAAGSIAVPPASPVSGPQAMAEHEKAMAQARAPKSWAARIVDWIGRVHPFAVHFPIALFPIAWLALMLARRRGDAVDVIRSLILVAGASAAIAGALGWLDAGFALGKDDRLLAAHRWIGTALGLTGVAVAIWAWRHSSSVDSRAMVWLLGAVTFVLLVQGWIGGALIHGIDHMNM